MALSPATLASESVMASLLASFAAAPKLQTPYPHWFLDRCLPPAMSTEVLKLPFEAPGLGGVSGKRELHNNTRKYFDAENMAKYPVCAAVATAFQDPRVVATVEDTFGAKLSGTYVRIEYAQDIDGFWLEPHTDLGVKAFTLLMYLSTDPQHAGLGTDIYDAEKRHVGVSPFKPNGAMVFVPSDNTYHGFEKRPITGVRTSVIVNYVTNDWRAREQLAFPDSPVQR